MTFHDPMRTDPRWYLSPTSAEFRMFAKEQDARFKAQFVRASRPRLRSIVHSVEVAAAPVRTFACAYNRPKSDRIAEIKAQVCEKYGLTLLKITTKGRSRDPGPLTAREELCYLLREHTRLSWPHIAKHTGYGDHSAAIYAANKHRQRIGEQRHNRVVQVADALPQHIKDLVARHGGRS